LEYVLFKTLPQKDKSTDCCSSEQFYILELLMFYQKEEKKHSIKKKKTKKLCKLITDTKKHLCTFQIHKGKKK